MAKEQDRASRMVDSTLDDVRTTFEFGPSEEEEENAQGKLEETDQSAGS